MVSSARHIRSVMDGISEEKIPAYRATRGILSCLACDKRRDVMGNITVLRIISMKIQKKVLREIYDLHSIIGAMKNAFINDRDENRAKTIITLADKGLAKGQALIDSQDPL